MSLYIASLNSGSNGNCFYIGNDVEAVLVDVGISCRQVERRMLRLELSIKKVKAVFITHEHTDHIYGLCVLARKYELPVYITPQTLKHGRLLIPSHLLRTFQPYQPVKIGKINVSGFTKLHDAIDPHSFIIENNNVTVGVFTDIGSVCQDVRFNFRQCHAAFLESNYDEYMLENGRYPYMLKNRIRGGKGHLSNKQALELFANHKPDFMSHLVLSHLSRDNNSPDLVQSLFSAMAGNTHIVVASRYEETPVYHITDNSKVSLNLVKKTRQINTFIGTKRNRRAAVSQFQLSLF